jgi:hypothetical protein
MECVPEGPTCCSEGIAKGTCLERDFSFVATTTVIPVVVDDDGDPLDLSFSDAGGCLTSTPPVLPCTGDSCSPTLTMCGDRWACAAWSPSGTLSVTGGDGVATVSGQLPVDGACRR